MLGIVASRLPNGDPAKMAKRIIDRGDQKSAPKRFALGSDASTVTPLR